MCCSSVCWNLSRGADLTAEVDIRFSALHRSLIAQRKKNNLVFVSACLSMTVKLADGRLAGVPGRGKRERKEGSKSGKSREGENRNPESQECLPVLRMCFYTCTSLAEQSLSHLGDRTETRASLPFRTGVFPR